MGLQHRRFLILVAALVAALSGLGGIALGAKRHPGLSAARVLADQSRAPVRVIVLLRNQHSNLPPNAHQVRARAAALSVEQRPLQAAVRSSGGRVTHSFQTINAFSAVVTRAERTRLASNRNVAMVLPDSYVPPPADVTDSPASGAGSTDPGSGTGVAVGDGQICGTPANPIVAPEGLSLINAPQAQQIATGSGVTVAFIAEGIDPNNPDFIRPDGSHVFVDYRDFTGQGPNSQTGGAEAFGDASTIAAQGRVKYDLSQFTNASHPLPPGCDIVLKGVAPGASLVGMKVFPTFNGIPTGAYTSTIIQGMDWAVSHDHVNVLNESFGLADIPDSLQDVTKVFNQLAEQAGVVVTASTGDQGTSNTIGSPASGPAGIAAGATTQFQGLAQTTRGGYQLSPKGWLNDNIANFSSAGFTESGKTLDIVAPGNESFEACDASPEFVDCKNLNGAPSNISTFGGTSESAPMTAGVAALVIQAYRNTHGGATPSPELVKQLILSNADDLNIPSWEQGAGELNALAAVRAAESYARPSRATGDGRLVSPTQLDLATQPGSSTGGDVTLTNDGASPETYNAHLRALQGPFWDQHGDVTLSAADPTYQDYKGVPQSYVEFTFTVPANADRLDGTIAWPGNTDPSQPGQTVNMTLFDPQGRMAAYTYQANGTASNYGHIDVRNPTAGTWTAAIFTPKTDNAYDGVVHYDLSASRFGTLGSVSPSTVTLAPGQSSTLHVSLNAPAQPGDYSRDLEVSGSSGKTTVVPVVVRSLVPLDRGFASFSGVLRGGNGNGFPAEEDTYAFDVPSGAPALNLQFKLPSDPNTPVTGYLISPTAQALGQQVPSQDVNGVETLQIYRSDPAPGRWLFVLATSNPVGGTTTAGPFSGTVSLAAPPVSATGVPNSTTLAPGSSTVAHVRVTNTGNSPMNIFIDPRRSDDTLYSLPSLTPATGIPLPLNTLTNPPLYIVPTQTDELFAAAQASAPVTFDWGFNDPDLEATSHGDSASGAFSEPEVTPGIWFIAPNLIGPFAGPTAGTVSVGMVAQARTFDTSVKSSTGDVEYDYVNPSAPPATPVTVDPGQTATIPVTFTASTRRGDTVSGDLLVDDNVAPNGSANEIKAIPYSYRVR
ncbi:MAG TPA: S8 family serine peptidase [Solirubrobacteraceae bacterium]|nr:S8 family serine peptidase [Solirubrobacteraceae bacterium]